MNPKLQSFPQKNDGVNSVGLSESASSSTEITSNDAGLSVTVEDSTTSGNSSQTPVRERPDPRLDEPRCEVARSAGYDPTGENAVACGARAQVICEYCGPMCASCTEETFCYFGEHKLSALEQEDESQTVRPKRRRRVSEVVYVEIKCPNCRRVRLALPKKHRPKARRKCPVCKKEAPAEYLAHGFTRRRLPYHEVFEVAEPLELTILPGGKRRVPWDVRDLANSKEK